MAEPSEPNTPEATEVDNSALRMSDSAATEQEAMDARSFAIEAARLAADTRCAEVTIIDLRGLSSVADYFVIGTGTSDRQMRATLETIDKRAREVGRRAYRMAKPHDDTWLLSDYVDVMVHVFGPSWRSYYDLDGLWGDAPRVDWSPPVA
ncbi:MAG: ribosome silencing factor [Phycisphaerales bacterium]|nr:ribosome silencing factor [Phycisphaerales bacterium]